MTAPERRLDALAAGLTARERAVLILRAWLDGQDEEDRLHKHMPAEQKEECERIVAAVVSANQEFHWACGWVIEWLFQEETRLAWLECLDGFLTRTHQLEAALEAAGWKTEEGAEAAIDKGRKTAVLTPLPRPGRGFERDLPFVIGEKAFPDDDRPLPATWQEARDHLVLDYQRAVELRWQDYLARGTVLSELSELLGENMVHEVGVGGPLEAIRRKVLELYEAGQGLAGRFPLPDPGPASVERLRGWVRWDDVREAPAESPPASTNGRGWMRPDDLAELEALEARLAGELRSGHPATGS